jgi:hypothetical protein
LAPDGSRPGLIYASQEIMARQAKIAAILVVILTAETRVWTN